MKKRFHIVMTVIMVLCMGLFMACAEPSSSGSENNPIGGGGDPTLLADEVNILIDLPVQTDDSGNVVNETGRVIPEMNDLVDHFNNATEDNAPGDVQPLAVNPPFPTNVAYGGGDLIYPNCTSLSCMIDWSGYIQPDFSLLVTNLLFEFNSPKTVFYWYGGYPRTDIDLVGSQNTHTCDSFMPIPDPNNTFNESPVCCAINFRDTLSDGSVFQEIRGYDQTPEGLDACIWDTSDFRFVFTGDDNNNGVVDVNSYDHPLVPFDGVSEDIKLQISLWAGNTTGLDLPSMVWDPTWGNAALGAAPGTGAYTEVIPNLLIHPTDSSQNQKIWIHVESDYLGIIPNVGRVPRVGGAFLEQLNGAAVVNQWHLVYVGDMALTDGTVWVVFMINVGDPDSTDNRGEFITVDGG